MVVAGVEVTMQQIIEENALLRGVICLAIVRLDGLTGEPGQDVERTLATIRDELDAALDGDREGEA